MRKKRIVGSVFFALVLLILITLRDPSVTDLLSAPAPLPAGTYQVVKVVDGDTITILKDNKNQRVRLIGVDTPETVDPRRPVQCFGEAAAAEATRLLDNKAVRLETDPSQDTYDTYGRLLAYVYVDDVFVNEHLIAEGFGHEYTYKVPYAYREQFRAAEHVAKAAEKGLWAPGACD